MLSRLSNILFTGLAGLANILLTKEEEEENSFINNLQKTPRLLYFLVCTINKIRNRIVSVPTM
jgi:hypothetical protein